LEVGLRFAPADNIYPTLPRTLHFTCETTKYREILSKPYNSILYKVSRGIVEFSYVLYGKNKLYMDSYVIFLKYHDAHTSPPCRKIYKNELHQKIFQKFRVHGAQRDTEGRT
jgi:hypothetical protein